MRVVVPRGKCPINEGSCPMGVDVLRRSCPQGSFPKGSSLRGSCPRGSCPRTIYINFEIHNTYMQTD